MGRCGESICFIGIVVWAAAGVFWIMGEVIPFFHNSGYHGLNMMFFYLAYILLVCGPCYALMARGKMAFARETEPPLLQVDDEETGSKEEVAPTPYVTLPA